MRERLGFTSDLEALREKARKEHVARLMRAEGHDRSRRAPLGLPKPEKAPAQVVMFDVPPDPRAVDRKAERREAARAYARGRR